MGRALAVTLASACCLVGCTLLVGTSGLTGGSGSTDAGTGSESQPAVDAGGDRTAEAGDATGPAMDASTDAAPTDGPPQDAPAEAGTFCSTQSAHFFCADFDEGSATAGWTRVDMQTAQGTLGLSPQYVSPPASLLSSVPAISGSSEEARVVEVFPVAVPSHIHVEFDMFACGASTPGYYEFAKIHEFTPATGVSGGIDLGSSGGNDYLLLDEYADDGGEITPSFAPNPPIPVSQWAHVALDAVLDPNNGAVTLVVNRASTPSVSQTGLRTLSPGTTNVEMVIGVASGGNSGPACETDYDNVVIDYN